MKIAWKLIMVMAFVALAISCLKVEPTPQFLKSNTSFSVTSSVATVAASATDSLSAVITFTWNDPKYAVGLSSSKFSVVVGATGKNFVSFSSKDFNGILSGALLGKEINGMALKFGGVIGQPITLDVKVVASQSNNNEPMSSNVLQVAVTPYGDLVLTPSATSVICSAATSSQVGTALTWNTAFNGYSGVKMYQLQYAKGGTSFASPTSSAVTTFSKSYSQLDLNKIALGYGVAGGSAGTVDFRIKATNESGTVLYSNVVTITVTTYVANNSIGVIGDATPGGWNTDTDLYRPDPINKPADWTVTLYLIGGKSAKFRADDAWATNWGDTGFPSGTGTAGGPNIPIANSGYYQVNFNAGSGNYTFTPLTTPVYTNVSVIGDATPGGWSTDTQLTQSATDNQVWTGTVAMTAGGSMKFRANNAWTTNWGLGYVSPTGLSGWGSQNGANVPVTTSGTYFVYINAATGEFFLGNTSNSTPYTQIGIIGDGTPGAWSTDTYLIQDPANPYKWSAKVTLTAAFAKFRANSAWTVNWGNTTFPNGVGTAGGPNIPVNAGTPQITFNSATGEYTFTY
jgi:hypothetical protein